MKKNTARYLRFLPVSAWGLTIGVFSLLPLPPVPESGFLAWDKLQHAGAYAVFTLLVGYAYSPRFRFPIPWLIAFTAAVFYGGIIEIAQGKLTVVRAAEWGDLAADALGAALVLLLACFTQHPASIRR